MAQRQCHSVAVIFLVVLMVMTQLPGGHMVMQVSFIASKPFCGRPGSKYKTCLPHPNPGHHNCKGNDPYCR
ncbi:hypothetical protein Pyn_39293 [Prunus yedoensis var. nudiflora]|uniref:Uncharacterized protein n=1 Tax=Prunus yedoensis var. nudiflora TaxID=2094558 RepID=A0A314XSJ9_PRUYE|nr:hypothetical protein Pyn_39293 [Prunus yedoensis var. nudiflora]